MSRKPWCKYCGQGLQWCTTTTGSVVALDKEPVARGTGAFVVRGHGLKALAVAPQFRRRGEASFNLHRRSCKPAQEEYERHLAARQMSLF